MYETATRLLVASILFILVGCVTPKYQYSDSAFNDDPVVEHNLKQERDSALSAYFDCLREETDTYSQQRDAQPQDIAAAATYTCERYAQGFGAVIQSQARVYRLDSDLASAIHTDVRAKGRSFVIKRVLQNRME